MAEFGLHPRGWTRRHRLAILVTVFLVVAVILFALPAPRLVNSGALGDPDTWDYYGPALPPHLCHLSATCKVLNFNSSAASADARTARVYGAKASVQLYVPAWVGTPDDSAGLAHFDDTPKGPFDGYGQLDCPAAAVGDGWWWLDRCGR